MTYIGRDLADEEDIEEVNANIDAILDILKMKGIIPSNIDHWNVIEFRNNLRIEEMNNND